MAGDGSDSCRSVDGRIAKEIQTELGILAIHFKQYIVACMGAA